MIPRPVELEQIARELLSDNKPQASVLALWGMTGTGKSTLASQYIQQYEEHYPGGVLWAELGPQFRPEQGVQPILAKWADWGYGGFEQLAQAMGQKRVDIHPRDIRQLFRGHGNMLVVLDDVHSSEHLSQLLEAIPDEATLLITTPELKQVKNIDFSIRPIKVDKLREADAISLLQGRLPNLDPMLLRQLAFTFDYHAQALTIISAELQSQPDSETATQNVLQQQNHTATLKPILTAVESSYQQLPSERDRLYFQNLGVLKDIHATFSLEMAAFIWDETLETAQIVLETLRLRALLNYDIASNRWSMNVLVRNYVHDLLKARGMAVYNAVEWRYQQYVIRLAVNPGAWVSNQPDIPHLQHVGNELITALETLLLVNLDTFNIDTIDSLTTEPIPAEQQPHLRITASYINSASTYLLTYPEAYRFAEKWLKALTVASQTLGVLDEVASGLFLWGQWHLYGEKIEQALDLFQRSYAVAQDLGDVSAIGYTLSSKGSTLHLMGRTSEAIATFEHALQIIEDADHQDHHLRVILLTSLSQLYLSINEHEQASQYLETAAGLNEGAQSEKFSINIAQQLAILLINRGKPEVALKKLQQARSIAESLQNKRMVAELDLTIGMTYDQLGERENAIAKFKSVLNSLDVIAYPRLKPGVLTGLASVKYSQGDFTSARDYLHQALQLLEQYQNKSQEAQVLTLLGEVVRNLSEPDTALTYLKSALPLLRDVQDTTTAVRIFHAIGMIYKQTERLSEGIDYLKQSLPTIKALNNAGAEVTILNWIAVLLSDIGDMSQAMELFDQAEPIIAAIENDTERAAILNLTAQFYWLTGKHDKAILVARNVVEIWRKLNNKPKLTESLLMLAEFLFYQSDVIETQRLLSEVNELIESEEQPLAQAQYYNLRGLLYLREDRFDDAQMMLERSAGVNKRIQNPALQIVNLTNLASLRISKQDIKGAQTDLEKALAVAREQELPPYIATALFMLGYLSHLKGERSQASNHLKEAIRVLEEAGMTVDASNQSIESLRVFEKTIREDSDKALPEESLKLMLQVMNWKGLKFMLQLRSDTLLSEEVDFILDATTADAKEKKQLPLEENFTLLPRST